MRTKLVVAAAAGFVVGSLIERSYQTAKQKKAAKDTEMLQEATNFVVQRLEEYRHVIEAYMAACPVELSNKIYHDTEFYRVIANAHIPQWYIDSEED